MIFKNNDKRPDASFGFCECEKNIDEEKSSDKKNKKTNSTISFASDFHMNSPRTNSQVVSNTFVDDISTKDLYRRLDLAYIEPLMGE